MWDNRNRAYVAIAGGSEICLLPGMSNRHGLITGATGTGKTITLQTLAETFSQMGVPVFAADVKGDLSGVAVKGGNKESVAKRVEEYALRGKGFEFQSFPVQFWDVFGELGTPVRASVSDMGPLLLARLLNLNDTQSAVLTVAFKIAADEKLELVDLKDLRKTLEYVGLNASKLALAYGNIPTASIGSIQRGLIALEHDGADKFFGEPGLYIEDFMQTQGDKGVINILASEKLMQAPKTYSTFLLWLLNKLFTALPEVGDPEKPKLVFFFDEAHLLFNDAPKALLEKIEQVVRLIRSKGVGIFFISQSPADMPETVLGQLGNRVQHTLRAYTPKDQRAVKAAAASFRPNSAFNTETVIAELGVGEALVSFLDAMGAPRQVERAFILPPQSQVGPLEESRREQMVKSSPLHRHYATPLDRVTAYEVLSKRLAETPDEKELTRRRKDEEKRNAQREREEAAKERKEERLAQRKAAQRNSLVRGVYTSIVAPLIRQFLRGMFK